jgi:exodeoxyribonuclease-3
VRLATWNVNGIQARLELVLHWLRERRPDVVGLQEIKAEDARFPRAAIEAAGYAVATHGEKAWNGVAVLSRVGLAVTRTGLPGKEACGARLLEVEAGGFGFTTLYCPNGKHVAHDDFRRKLAWLDALVDHVATRHEPARPALLCGDFNLCPGPLDTWDEAGLRGTLFHTEEERERFRRLLALGLSDVLRERHPELRAYTWWDYRAGAFHRGQGLRIDLVLASEPLARRVRAVEVDRDYRKKRFGRIPSDHAPVLVELD